MHLQIIVFAYLLFMELFLHLNKMYSKIIRQIIIVENKFRMPSVSKSFLELSLGVTFSYVYVKLVAQTNGGKDEDSCGCKFREYELSNLLM